MRRSLSPHCQDSGVLAPAYKRKKRTRTAPSRFETMIAVPRGGTMRMRTLEECLMQTAFFASEGEEVYGNCQSVFLPLFEGGTPAHDTTDEVGLSLQLSRAYLRRNMSRSALLDVDLLEARLTDCIRAQYMHLVYQELRDERGRILSFPESAVDTPKHKTGAAEPEQQVEIILNADEHVRILSLLMAEERVAESYTA